MAIFKHWWVNQCFRKAKKFHIEHFFFSEGAEIQAEKKDCRLCIVFPRASFKMSDMNISRWLGAAHPAKRWWEERRGCHLWIEGILWLLTHQMFWGGEVSGGHLSAECLLVSMLSTEGAWLSSSGWIMVSGRKTGSKRAEGEGEEKREWVEEVVSKLGSGTPIAHWLF